MKGSHWHCSAGLCLYENQFAEKLLQMMHSFSIGHSKVVIVPTGLLPLWPVPGHGPKRLCKRPRCLDSFTTGFENPNKSDWHQLKYVEMSKTKLWRTHHLQLSLKTNQTTLHVSPFKYLSTGNIAARSSSSESTVGRVTAMRKVSYFGMISMLSICVYIYIYRDSCSHFETATEIVQG